MDTDSDTPVDWGEIFFILHKHCNLNKWEIFEYTIPQVTDLLKRSQKHIQFEIETTLTPFKAFMGGEGDLTEGTEISDDDLDFMERMAVI